MSYQSVQHSIATRQNIELIRHYISAGSRKIVDIGCNEGLISMSLARAGYKVLGIESNPEFSRIAEHHSKEPIRLGSFSVLKASISSKNIEILEGADSIFLLSVHHQFVSNLGLEAGNALLLEIFKRAKTQFFFQPACIHSKYGISMPFLENVTSSIENYFLSLFSGTRDFSYRLIGLTDNRLPSSEPLRPLMLFEFEEVKARLRLPLSPSDAKRSKSDLVHIPIDRCSSHFWFNYGSGGDHPMQKQAMQLVRARGDLSVTETALCVHYNVFQPRTYGEAAKLRHRRAIDNPLGELSATKYLPLRELKTSKNGTWSKAIANAAEIPDWDQNIVGPQEEEKIVSEIRRLAGIAKSLKEKGYDPDLFEDGYIRGIFIESRGDWRFLLTAGMHRLSVMTALGYVSFQGKLQPGLPPVLDCDSASLPPDFREYLSLFFSDVSEPKERFSEGRGNVS
jgi:hypothetical protein